VLPNFFADYNKKYHNHYYRPHLPNFEEAELLSFREKYTVAYNNYLNGKYMGMNR
jgi:hypothetical protein